MDETDNDLTTSNAPVNSEAKGPLPRDGKKDRGNFLWSSRAPLEILRRFDIARHPERKFKQMAAGTLQLAYLALCHVSSEKAHKGAPVFSTSEACIAAVFGLSIRTVTSAIQQLEAAGVIGVVRSKAPDGKQNLPNQYTLYGYVQGRVATAARRAEVSNRMQQGVSHDVQQGVSNQMREGYSTGVSDSVAESDNTPLTLKGERGVSIKKKTSAAHSRADADAAALLASAWGGASAADGGDEF